MVDESRVRKEILSIKPYVPGKPIEEVKRELGLDEVIKLASNENSLGPSSKAVKKMKEAVEEVNIYPDGNIYRLRQKISSKLGVKEDELIFGNGSDELLALLGQAFINPEDEIIMGGTTFSEYDFATNLMGGKITKVPLQNYTHDLEGMLEAVSKETKMVFICNPNNPTGTIVTESEVENFLAQIPDDVLVVFDEAYCEYVMDKDYPDTIDYLSSYDNIIILRTFSKAYGLAGLRIGYGIASRDIVGYLGRVRQPFNVDAVAQKGALAALTDKEHLRKTIAYNNQGKEYLYQQFEELGLEYVPTEANFIMVDVGQSAEEIFDRMLKKGVIIRDLGSFGYETKIRVTVGLPEENRRFLKVLEEVL